MAKIIRLTPEIVAKIQEQIIQSLSKIKLSDGKVTYSQSFDNIDRKATIYFSEVAWSKMVSLVFACDKEVAWHGLVKRGEDESVDEYHIYDLLIYPQEVTGCTVNTDQERYQQWLYDRPDEEFNDIRMQGHSHVNMSTTPSAVDNTYYDKILEQLTDDMFYIFMVWNKRGEKTIRLYDLKKNILFETKDCEIKIEDNGMGVKSFLESASTMVVQHTYAAPATNKASIPSNKSANITPNSLPANVPSEPKQPEPLKPEKEPEAKNEAPKTSGLRKGKRRPQYSGKSWNNWEDYSTPRGYGLGGDEYDF